MASHVRIATRGMHTGGRRVPFPGLGGAGKVPPATGGSVSTAINALKPDSRHPPQPDVSAGLSRGLLQHAGFIPRRNRRHVTPALDPPELRDYTVHGKPILHRPPRTIPVNLPSGYPEPPTYPPPQEYLDTVKERRQPAHRLWQFFHLTEEAKEALPVAGQKAPRMGDSLNLRDKDNLSGRSWLISELRAKSFADLHVLWYVLLKERNVLETQKLERRRVEVPTGYDKDMIVPRLRKVRVAMARIKLVLNERRLALLAATGPHWDRIEREKAAESERETAAAIAEGRPLPKPVRVAAAPDTRHGYLQTDGRRPFELRNILLPLMLDATSSWRHGFSTMLNVSPASPSSADETLSLSSTFHLAVTIGFLALPDAGSAGSATGGRGRDLEAHLGPLPPAGQFSPPYPAAASPLSLKFLQDHFPGPLRTLPLSLVVGSVSEPTGAMHSVRWSDLHLDRRDGREVGRMVHGEGVTCEDGWIVPPPSYDEACQVVPYDW